MKRLAVAVIDEARCIGCAQCLPPCPVDAIIGAKGFVHTVFSDWCVGCRLCLAPCPVDCITLAPPPRAWTAADARGAIARNAARHERRLRARETPPLPNRAERQAALEAALRGRGPEEP